MELKDPTAKGILRIAMPTVYRDNVGLEWCKLDEILRTVRQITLDRGMRITFTGEELIRNFAALIPTHESPKGSSNRKKIFRYSVDGLGFMHTEVPLYKDHNSAFPPYVEFWLGLPRPYPLGLYVPAAWTKHTLDAIRRGAIAAADFGGQVIGFPPSGEPGTVQLSTVTSRAIVRTPKHTAKH